MQQAAPAALVDPLDRYAKLMGLQASMGQQDLQQRHIGEFDRKAGRSRALEALLSTDDGTDTEGALRRGGFLDESLKYGKDRRENAKTDAETTTARVGSVDKLLGVFRRQLDLVDSPQAAAQWLTAQYRDPVLGPVVQGMRPAEEALASIPTDPQGFANWRKQAGMGIEKFAADERAREQNAETRRSNQARETETGRHNVSTERTAAGNLSVAQGNLGVSRQRLDFERTQGRAPAGYRFDTQGNLQAIPGGPADPANKDAPEALLKAAGYSDRMKKASRIFETEQAGQTPGFVEAMAPGGKAGNLAANVSRDPVRQKYHQAAEDWVRAKLRQESGAVIADEEMSREIRTYFPQIGDQPEVIAQKTAARRTAEQAMTTAAGRAGRPAAGATAGWSITPVREP